MSSRKFIAPQSWFSVVTGATERDFSAARARFVLAGQPVPTPGGDSATAPTLEIFNNTTRTTRRAGVFYIASMSSLRAAATTKAKQAKLAKPCLFEVVCRADAESVRMVDVAAMQADPSNAGAMFQVATNWNCLCAISNPVPDSPGFTESLHVVTQQGPSASLSAGAAAIARVHAAFYNPGVAPKDWPQTKDHQVDTLVSPPLRSYFGVSNGFAVITDSQAALPTGNPAEMDRLLESMRVGIQLGADVIFGERGRQGLLVVERPHMINQVFCSAINVGGGQFGQANRAVPGVSDKAAFVLRAAYRGTYLAAVANNCKALILTMIGGGVFGNDPAVIFDAIFAAHNEIALNPAVNSCLQSVKLCLFADVPALGQFLRRMQDAHIPYTHVSYKQCQAQIVVDNSQAVPPQYSPQQQPMFTMPTAMPPHPPAPVSPQITRPTRPPSPTQQRPIAATPPPAKPATTPVPPRTTQPPSPAPATASPAKPAMPPAASPVSPQITRPTRSPSPTQQRQIATTPSPPAKPATSSVPPQPTQPAKPPSPAPAAALPAKPAMPPAASSVSPQITRPTGPPSPTQQRPTATTPPPPAKPVTPPATTTAKPVVTSTSPAAASVPLTTPIATSAISSHRPLPIKSTTMPSPSQSQQLPPPPPCMVVPPPVIGADGMAVDLETSIRQLEPQLSPKISQLILVLEDCIMQRQSIASTSEGAEYIQEKHMTQDEVLALMLFEYYTLGCDDNAQFSAVLNKILTDNKPEELKSITVIMYNLMSALSKLSSLESEVFVARATRTEHIAQGALVVWPGLTTATRNLEEAAQIAGPAGIVYRVKARDAKDAALFCLMSTMNVLLPPNVQMLVVHEATMDVGLSVLCADLQQRV